MALVVHLLLLSLSLAVANAAPSIKGRTQYAPSVIPSVWKQIGNAPADKSITFDLIFQPKDTAGLEERMLEISNSKSAWLTEEEIASYIAPSDDIKTIVEAAVKAGGADSFSYSRNGDTMSVTTTIAKAAKVRIILYFTDWPILKITTSSSTPSSTNILILRSTALSTKL